MEWIKFNTWDNQCVSGREYLISSRGYVTIAIFVDGSDNDYFDGWPYVDAYMQKPDAYIE